MNELEQTVKNWCLSHIGEGYIYGAKGQICSPSFRKQQAEQYPSYESIIMSTGAKWDGFPVWDCAQFTRYAAKQGGVELVSGATSQWNKTNWAEKGTIDGLPSDCVCFLYRYSGGKMQHTGVYLGDGSFAHAKGTAYGVLHQQMREYNWTHYAIPFWGEQQGKGEETQMDIIRKAYVTASSVNVRKSPSTSSTRLGVLQNGEAVDIVEEGADWLSIAYNEGKAYVMRQYISEPSESGKEAKIAMLESVRDRINALIDVEIDKLE